MKDVLSSAGIDVSVFSAHSTRSASTSAALAGGASIESILKAASWSSDCTFATFYNKCTVDFDFANAVYNSAQLP